jgi:hypothetical protein
VIARAERPPSADRYQHVADGKYFLALLRAEFETI